MILLLLYYRPRPCHACVVDCRLPIPDSFPLPRRSGAGPASLENQPGGAGGAVVLAVRQPELRPGADCVTGSNFATSLTGHNEAMGYDLHTVVASHGPQ